MKKGTSKETTLHVLKYIGGKGRMAGVLSRLIPDTCTVYAELYCGSAALALNSRKFDVKILNDYNPHIANFWKVATTPEMRAKLLKRLQETSYSWSAFEAAQERQREHGTKQSDPIQWAVDTYILVNQSFNADMRTWTYQDAVSYKNKLVDPLKIPLAFKSLAGQEFQVFSMDAIACMKENQLLENPKAFIFLDPPYLEGLRCGWKLYQVDMPDFRDHIDLLKAIRQAKAKIVLSGYWSGRDDGSDLYDAYLVPHGWHRHLLGEYVKGCDVNEGKSKGFEWVWCNYDLKQEAPKAIGLLKSYCAEKIYTHGKVAIDTVGGLALQSAHSLERG